MHRGLLFVGVVKGIRALPSQPGETRAPLHSVSVEVAEEVEPVNLLVSDADAVTAIKACEGREAVLRVTARKGASGNVNLWVNGVAEALAQQPLVPAGRGG